MDYFKIARLKTAAFAIAACAWTLPAGALSATPSSTIMEAPKVGHLSKLETRHLRHGCERRAQKRALSGASAETFVIRCLDRRVAHRQEAFECRLRAKSDAVDLLQMHNFMKACVRNLVQSRKLNSIGNTENVGRDK
jgi:hypothetical protein